jgi:hypothetical protein
MKAQVKNKVQFNEVPQFGLTEKQWKQLISTGKKSGKSLIPLVREALVKTLKLA